MSKTTVRILFALVVTVAAVGAIFAIRSQVTLEEATVDFQYADDAVNPMWVRVEASDGRERDVTITWGRLETTVVHDGQATQTYFFERGLGRPEPITVHLSEETEVSFGSGLVEDDNPVDLGNIVWDQVGPDRYSAEGTPATDEIAASAAVDESYSWGLIVEGIGLRTTAEFDTDRTGEVVAHEDEFDIICWTMGDPITNGSDGELADDATQFSSEIWWKVQGLEGEGFISNTWFARVESADELNVPTC